MSVDDDRPQIEVSRIASKPSQSLPKSKREKRTFSFHFSTPPLPSQVSNKLSKKRDHFIYFFQIFSLFSKFDSLFDSLFARRLALLIWTGVVHWFPTSFASSTEELPSPFMKCRLGAPRSWPGLSLKRWPKTRESWKTKSHENSFKLTQPACTQPACTSWMMKGGFAFCLFAFSLSSQNWIVIPPGVDFTPGIDEAFLQRRGLEFQ